MQRERNEIKRTLDHIPAGMKKPKAEELAQLKRGQFFVCWDDQIFKTYVQPAWASEYEALQAAAAGAYVDRPAAAAFRQQREQQAVREEAEPARGAFTRPTAPAEPSIATFDGPEPEPEEDHNEEETVAHEAKILEVLERIEAKLDGGARDAIPTAPAQEVPSRSLAKAVLPVVGGDDEEMLFRRFRDRLLRDPIVLKVLATEKRIEVTTKEHTLEVDGSTMNGRIALLVKDGFFETARSGNAVWTEIKKKGWPAGAKMAPGSLYDYLSDLARDGFLTVNLQDKTYTSVDDAAKRIRIAKGG